MKKYVVLVSHGELAQGMHSVLDMFAGKSEEVLSTSLENGMSTEQFAQNFRALITPITKEDQVILFADILGGSPLTMALSILHENALLEQTITFTGMNVGSCLTAVLSKDTIVEKDILAENIIAEGRSGIQQYTMVTEEEIEDL